MKTLKILPWIISLLLLIISIILFKGYTTYNAINKNQISVLNKWEQLEPLINEKITSADSLDLKYELMNNYNNAVKDYNISVRKFFNRYYAKYFGLETKEYFSYKEKEIP